MFLRKKQKNRRFERHEVLDVKLRAQPGRSARKRMVLMSLMVALSLVASFYLWSRLWNWGRARLLDDSKAFTLNTVEVETDGWISSEQVLGWAGIKVGDNLLTMDLPKIRRDLGLQPQIESISIDRVFPHLLRLRVSEREPVAQVCRLQLDSAGRLSPSILYLDAKGVVIPPLDRLQQPASMTRALEALPTIRGIGSSELRPGQVVNVPAVHAALRLLAEFDRSPMAAQAVVQVVDVAAPEVLEVTTTQGTRITFRRDDFEKQFQRWRLVQDAGAAEGKAVSSLDLSVPNNCPVLWLEASAVPPAQPRAARPLRNR